MLTVAQVDQKKAAVKMTQVTVKLTMTIFLLRIPLPLSWLISLSTQLTTTPEPVLSDNMNPLASSAPATVNRQPGPSMKRLRNVLASYVKAPDAVASSSNTGVKQSHCEASTPVVPSTFDKDNAVPSIVTTESLNNENRKRLKSVESSKSNVPTQPLPRKGSNSKRMTSFSSTMEAGLSEDSSSDSEGEESGEVTNSDSEDEATKPKPAKLAKWDSNSSASMQAESSSSKGKGGLELRISISRQYYSGRSLPTPVTTPKSPVSYHSTCTQRRVFKNNSRQMLVLLDFGFIFL